MSKFLKRYPEGLQGQFGILNLENIYRIGMLIPIRDPGNYSAQRNCTVVDIQTGAELN